MTVPPVVAELDDSRRRLYDLQMQMLDHAKDTLALSESLHRVAEELQRARDSNFNARELVVQMSKAPAP